jgi:hypothetical protein
MSPLAGTIDADFNEFVAECQKADAGLAGIQSEAAKTEVAITEMAAATTDTATVTGDAIAGLGTKATGTTSGFTMMAGSLKTADKTLGAFGISINKEIGMLEELGQVSGQTAADIGLIGSATAVAGAAFAGWNIGRKIAELTGADEAIANLTARLLGWGDAAAQEAGAKADVLARATQNAGRQITDMTEAIKINYDAMKRNSEQYNTAANRAAEWQRELTKLGPQQSALRAEIESGNSTVAQMSQHFKVSAEAIDFLTRKMQAETAARKEANAETQKYADALQDLTALRKGEAAVLAEIGPATTAAIKGYLDLGASQTTLATAYGLTAAQIRAVADAYKAETAAAQEAAKAAAAASQFVTDLRTTHAREQADAQADSYQKQQLALGTWRAEQMAALAATKGASVEQFEAVARVYDEKLAAMNAAHAASVAAQVKGTGAVMSAEDQRWARNLEQQSAAIAHAQEYGVTLAQAYKDLGISADESFGLVTAGANEGRVAIDGATSATQRMTVQMQDLQSQARSAFEQMQAGMALVEAYREAGVATGVQTAMGGYNFQRQRETLMPTYSNLTPTDLTTPWGKGGATSTTTNLNVNVNNAGAQDIAQSLVTEMRHNGVRF